MLATHEEIKREMTRMHETLKLERGIERRFPGALDEATKIFYRGKNERELDNFVGLGEFEALRVFHDELEFTFPSPGELQCTDEQGITYTWDASGKEWLEEDVNET